MEEVNGNSFVIRCNVCKDLVQTHHYLWINAKYYQVFSLDEEEQEDILDLHFHPMCFSEFLNPNKLK